MNATLFPCRGEALRRLDLSARRPHSVEVVAPAGAGKTSLWKQFAEQVAASGDRIAVHVSAAECEGHEGLFVQALAAVLGRVLPVTYAPDRTGDPTWLSTSLESFLADAGEALGTRSLLLCLDDLGSLTDGETLTDALAHLAANVPQGLGLVLMGRSIPRACRRGDSTTIRRADLAWRVADIERIASASDVVDADALAQLLAAATAGWPALVVPALRACLGLTSAKWPNAIEEALHGSEGAARALGRTLLDGLRPEVQYVARLAAVVPEFDDGLMQRLLRGDVSGTVQERRRLIRLGPEAVAAHLDVLVEHQVLSVTADGYYGLCPGLRPAFLGELEGGARREACRRAATLVLEADSSDPSALAVDLLVEAQQLPRVLAILEVHAERFFSDGVRPHTHRDGRDLSSLRRWLMSLATFYSTPPAWVAFYLGRIATQAGRWEDAKEHLDQARTALQKTPSDAPWRWQPRLAVAFATLLWRRGAAAEALTWCRRGADRLASDRRRMPDAEAEAHAVEVRQLTLSLAALEARITMEVSSRLRSDAVLTAVLEGDGADAAWFAPTRAELSIHLMENAIRAGDTEAALRWETRARSLDVAQQDSRLACLLDALSARRALLTDDPEVALTLANRAIEQSRGDMSIARARALCSRAQTETALGQSAAAVATAAAALHMTEAAGGPACIVAEVLLAKAQAAVDSGQPEVASAALVEVESAIGAMLRLDGYLAAQHSERVGLVRVATEGSLQNGLRYLEAALESYGRYGARYDAGRVHWRLAQVSHQMVADGHSGAADAVFAHLSAAVAVIGPAGFGLPRQRDALPLLFVGMHGGDDAVQAFCEGRLEDASVAAQDVEAGVVSLLGHYPATRAGVRLPVAAWLSVTPNAIEPLDETTREILRATPSKKAFVVWAVEQEVDNFGVRLSLQQKRVMMPLLVRLLDTPGECLSMRELALDVWGVDATTPSIQTKIKVAISRLRSLLGKGRDYVVTRRKDEGGTSVVAYQIAPDLAFRVIRRGDENA
ncbi:MAG: tetratricopeptide (TPR) repeat protein [Myxococcota bacterium]|jgi:tetratricopeptide (TPR) repeat protein